MNENETLPDIRMSGWAHLQKAYVVKRDGRTALVPTHLLTEDEIEAHIRKWPKAHADELRTFAEARRGNDPRPAC